MTSTPTLDVLVPTRNRPVELATALAAQDEPFDVVISDQSDLTLLRHQPAAGWPNTACGSPPARSPSCGPRLPPCAAASSAPPFKDCPTWTTNFERLNLGPGEWRAYKIAWIGGCVLFDRAKLLDSGGFGFWRDLPEHHVGEDVVAQTAVLARHGGVGTIPQRRHPPRIRHHHSHPRHRRPTNTDRLGWVRPRQRQRGEQRCPKRMRTQW